jgi:hypothetical protein
MPAIAITFQIPGGRTSRKTDKNKPGMAALALREAFSHQRMIRRRRIDGG